MALPEFVSEPIAPEPKSFDAAAMARGEPGLPERFAWRGKLFRVMELLKTWKSSTRDRGELYLRKHWFEVRLHDGSVATIYCERQAKNRKQSARRWWIYSITRTSAPGSD